MERSLTSPNSIARRKKYGPKIALRRRKWGSAEGVSGGLW